MAANPTLWHNPLAVRFCVVLKLRPKENKNPVRFVWASTQKGLRSEKNGETRSEKNRTPQDLGETLVTECPYEAVGDFSFGRDLIRTQERTVWSRGMSLVVLPSLLFACFCEVAYRLIGQNEPFWPFFDVCRCTDLRGDQAPNPKIY